MPKFRVTIVASYAPTLPPECPQCQAEADTDASAQTRAAGSVRLPTQGAEYRQPSMLWPLGNDAHEHVLIGYGQVMSIADDGNFTPGTNDHLIALSNRFLFPRLGDGTIADFELYQGPVLEHWGALAERITKRVFRGQAVPRDPRLQ